MARRRTAKPQNTPEAPKGDDWLRKWKERVAQAQRKRKDWATRYKVEMGEQYFLGQQESAIVYNHLAATIKTNRPNLFFQTPKFFVRAKPKHQEPVEERKAAAGEGVMEAIARQDDHLEIAGNLGVLQAFFRIGVLKICYEPRMEPNPNAGKIVYQTRAGGEPIVDQASGQPVPMQDPLSGEAVKEPKEVPTDEAYRWRWVDASNMLLPDEGPDRTRWSWIGEEVIVSLDDAKADTRFNEGLREQLRPNIKTRQGKDARDRGMNPDVEDLIQYCEIYDIRKKRWYVWAEGQDFEDFLVDEPFPEWIDNDPYAILVLGDTIIGPEPSAWPKPLVYDWIGPQSEYNIRRNQINEGCKRSARKGVYTDGVFENEEAATQVLQSPDDMTFTKVQSASPEKLRILEAPPLSADLWRDLNALQADWRIITGQTGARLSDPDQGTATEASFVERAAGLRDADQQQAVTRWMGEAGRKMFQAIKATLTLDMWIQLREMNDDEMLQYVKRVYNVDPVMMKSMPGLKEIARAHIGQQKWQRVTREQLQFEADVTIVPGSTRPKNLDAERRNWLELLKVLLQGPQLMLSRELLRYTAEKFDVTDDRLIDELVALAQQMMQVAANTAGRNQGTSTSGGGGGVTAAPDIMAAVTGGAR